MSDYYWSSPDAAYSMDYIGNKLACERAPPPVSVYEFLPFMGFRRTPPECRSHRF